MTTVKQLKELIANLPDDAQVLVPGEDHSYRATRVEATTALREGSGRYGGWTEDHGEELTPEADYGKRMQVVVVT